MDVGIRELKTRLSELVARAAQGETIRITDRGKLKAELGPLSDRARIEQGVAEGWIRPRLRHDGVKGPRRPYKAPVTVEEMLEEDRADRSA